MRLKTGVYPILLGSYNHLTNEIVPHVGTQRSHSDMIRMAFYDAEENEYYYARWISRQNRWAKAGIVEEEEFSVAENIPQPSYQKGEGWLSTITTFRVKLSVDPVTGSQYPLRPGNRPGKRRRRARN